MNEGIMAVIVASAAFSGFSGVVIGQIKASKLQSKWKGAQKLLIISGALGILTAILGSGWFLIFNRNEIMGLTVFLFFVFQLLLFWVVASSFWQFDEKKNK